jgi:extracellular matrix regulatory protein A
MRRAAFGNTGSVVRESVHILFGRNAGGKVLTMAIKLINIGFGNIVSANRIISIVSPESAPIKRIIQEARDRHMLIDATYGRRTRAVIITDSDHVILSAVQPETVAHRLSTKDDENDE